ncbi:MAG: restriction endonuclease [Thalassospira sp.]|jgi:hypothetical protein|nr:restriction endonuclease [Thalassospira sp.]
MTRDEFELLLDKTVAQLAGEALKALFSTSKEFETRVREVLRDIGKSSGIKVDFEPHPYIFPDIVMDDMGVEVKFTANDTWRSVANSVFESTRSTSVKHIYVIFGKMGGTPSVKWGRYEDCVMHVRTSHVPRFEVEIGSDKSLFKKMGLTYDEFSASTMEDKMKKIRAYARSRLKEGEHLWWLEDKPESDHTLSLGVRLYMNLSQEEKRRFRAEAALLCPQIVKPSRAKNKYNDATMYLLTYHGVLCPQARDLFSAGSVAMRGDETRGGRYILRALADIEIEMVDAASRLDNALFVEYWGQGCAPEKRISEWLERADEYARDWVPSQHLFSKIFKS